MLEFVKRELLALNIDTVGSLPLSECNITRTYKLDSKGFTDHCDLSVIILAIPYYTHHETKNISSYCIPRDYHAFACALFSTLIPRLEARFEGHRFIGFADDSPIDERDAAAKAGLGIIGDNGMLITEKYSSYVFLAEIITDAPIERAEHYSIKRCKGCGACTSSCPKRELGECLSAITQKKGELSSTELDAIRKYGYAFGCDICQEVCPHTLKAIKDGTIYTNIDYFKTDLTPILSADLIEGMSDSEFSSRAYSWRKKDTLLRNIAALQNHKSE